jgi:polyphosphate kinase 2 (PPK2 family)
MKRPSLDAADLELQLSPADQITELAAQQQRLMQLRLAAAGLTGDRLGPPLTVLFEGWDASGKGGAIRRLTAALDPRHVRVSQFAAPTDDERRHHFLARFVPSLPGWGGMTVLDRSWYGRVLVERVEGFASEAEWERAYGQIAHFEEALCAEGMVLVKLWLHISSHEQLRRFRARETDPLKRYKLTDEDWRNRRRRRAYEAAVVDMFANTHATAAPWIVVAAEDKHYARVEVLRLVNSHYEEALRTAGVRVPKQIRRRKR